MEDVRKAIIKELAELFEIKINNPCVDFWFVGKDAMEGGEANKPADFDKYKFIEEKTDKDGIVWQLYGKQAIAGVFARSYWHK